MTTPYARGRRAEETLARDLRAAGWRVVRAAGSHTVCDLVAWDPAGQCWLIQVKGKTGWPRPLERGALVAWARAVRARAAIVQRTPRQWTGYVYDGPEEEAEGTWQTWRVPTIGGCGSPGSARAR